MKLYLEGSRWKTVIKPPCSIPACRPSELDLIMSFRLLGELLKVKQMACVIYL